MRTKSKTILTFLTMIVFCFSMAVFSITVIRPVSAAEADPLQVEEVQLLKNQDNGTNYWLVIKFNQNVVSHANPGNVNNEDVRSKLLINGKSIYAYEAEDKIATSCFYNYPVGQNLIRINIPVKNFSAVFNSDAETGEILNTEIVLQNGMKFENGVTVSEDIVVTYYSAADTFLLPGQDISSIATNVEAVHYYVNVKHLRIYFDAPVGSATTTSEIAQNAMEKILINGKSVKQRNLELYIDPASIIGPSSTEGNWFEWVDGKDVWGGATGHLNCRYMIRISLSSSTGSYNLKRDGTDVVEFLPGLKTANGKVLLNSVVFKLSDDGFNRVGWKDSIVDEWDKARNIVETDYTLSRGENNRAQLRIIPTGEFNPVSSAQEFSASEISMYFSQVEMNGRSIASIAGVGVSGYEIEDGKFGLLITFPENLVKFDGTDTFALLGGYVFPNGNDSRAELVEFTNSPMTATTSYDASAGKTTIILKTEKSPGDAGEYASLKIGDSAITVESVTANEIELSFFGRLKNNDVFTVPQGTIDGRGYAVANDIEYVYYAETGLLVSRKPSSYFLVDKVNAIKNQDGGKNSWVVVDFREPVVNYSGYPVKITGDEIANYGYIKLNGRPVTDAADTAENAGIGVYWTTESQLQIVIPSGNELLDFTKQLTISIEKEFRTILNAGSNGVFEQTLQKYSERDGMWKEVFSDDGLLFDTNMDLKVTGVGSYTDEGENVSFAITFNQDIAYGYFPHANSTATFMSSMLQQFYTQNEIKYFVYNGLGDSIRDNIILDGKSIWERMEVEGPIMNQYIMLHYGTVGTTTMQIFINKKSQSIDFVNTSKAHTLTIKAGFQVPNGGTIANDTTFVYNPTTKTWSLKGNGTSEKISVDTGKSSYPIVSKGCKGGIAMEGMLPVTATLLMLTAVVLQKRRKQS